MTGFAVRNRRRRPFFVGVLWHLATLLSMESRPSIHKHIGLDGDGMNYIKSLFAVFSQPFLHKWRNAYLPEAGASRSHSVKRTGGTGRFGGFVHQWRNGIRVR